MLTQVELDIIERYVSVMSRVGAFPVDWNSKAKAFILVEVRQQLHCHSLGPDSTVVFRKGGAAAVADP